MTMKRRVVSSTSTHFDVMDKVKVGDSEFGVENSQDAQMLIDPEETGGNTKTHSSDDIKFSGPKKVVKTTAAITDEQRGGPSDVHGLEHDVDPSVGYLEKEAGMPVLPVAQLATVDEGDEYEDNDDLVAEFNEDEFEGMDEVESDTDEFGNDMDEFPVGTEAETMDDEELVAEEVPSADPEDLEGEDFEVDASDDESVPLVDADETPDADEDEDLQFATIANVVHVIRSNRIIASMGAKTAQKIGAADIYLSPQFQDVVTATIAKKGLRKGLVHSGFILAKVKLTSSKTTAKVIESKVTAAVNKKVEALAKKDKSMEQCLAIAAVGINRRFFKDANNELKANLEAELVQAGVRGGARLVQAAFAQYGVSYAKSILTLANKISAMPEQVRNQYAEALDLTEDGDFESDDMLESDVDEDGVMDEEDDFEPIPASVTAALSSPIRRTGTLLSAGVKTNAALQILNGNQSLI